MRFLPIFVCCLFLASCDFLADRDSTVNSSPKFNEKAFLDSGLVHFFSWTEDRIPLVSAHRGGPYKGYPENAIQTFEHVIEQTPAIIECDIAMTKDSVLILMHDNTLDRTTTGKGPVQDQDWLALKGLRLKDDLGNLTDFQIPTLDEVLKWGKGKALFTLDVKRGVPFKRVVDAIRVNQMQDFAAVISYNANDALKIHQLDSSLMISVSVSDSASYLAHSNMGIPDEQMIAFVGVSEPAQYVYEYLHQKRITTILGVLGNLDKKAATKGDELYGTFIAKGADVLATDRPLEAAKVIRNLWPEKSEKYKFIEK